MIIYPSSLVLAAQAGSIPSLEYPRILYNNRLYSRSSANVTVSGETATGPRDAPLRPDTAEYWEPPSVPATWQCDLGAAYDIDCVALAGHNLGTTGASIEVRVSQDTIFDSYLFLPGSNGNRASTPDAAVWDVAASHEVVVKASLADWTPANEMALLSKWVAAGNQRSYQLTVEAGSTGKLVLRTTANGTTIRTHTSSVATGVADGGVTWARASRNSATGVVKFYLSADGIAWAQLGADVAGTIEGLFNSTAPVEIGASDAGTALPLGGNVYYADVRNGVGGAAVERFSPDDGINLATTFNSGLTGVTWTVSTSGSPSAVLNVRRFASALSPASNKPLMMMDVLRNVRHIRLTLTGAVARIPVIYAGTMLSMEKRVSPPYKPIDMARKTVLRSSMSRGGQFIGQSFRRTGVESGVIFKELTAAWVRASFDAFSQSARGLPYFFAWNALSYPNECGYVWTREDIVPSYNGKLDNMDVSWNMEGVA